MGTSYKIDRDRRLVRSRGWGQVSTEDIAALTSHILTDPRFRPSYRSLADFREITTLTGDSMGFAQIASAEMYAPGTRRALVATSDHVFGMLRMFAQYSERFGQVVQVFRDLDEAEKWLDEDARRDG